MKFLIRDDDTCAFTSPEELTSCYEGIWDKIPVALSVTPFRVPGDYHTGPESFRSVTEPLPLESNPAIVAFLKEKHAERKVEITLHGYEHTLPRGLPEYIGGTDLLEKTRKGKEYLESLLDCRLDTFVPPNNGIMREGLDAIVACGLNLVAIPSLLRSSFRPLRPENLPKYLQIKFHQKMKGRKYPHVLSFKDHKEIAYHSITPSQDIESLLEAFVNCQKADGVFVAAIHYHAFESRLKSGQTLRQALDLLIERAESAPNIQYPTFHELWNS
ncbi:MAG: DUF2334 domain-containing protein [Candidatus Krumholzibacteriota bacterium]